MLEHLIANHCAPALAGIKTANIVMCQKRSMPNICEQIKGLNMQLNSRDIYIDILCECNKRVMIIVYRMSVLEKHLMERKNKAFLERYGYMDLNNTVDYLELLKSRLTCDVFPHEIGVFLGYPLRDVYCFIKHRDKGCILTGEWKVYHNAEEAKKLFKRFGACKKAVSDKVASGKSLAEIFCAA